MKLSSRFHSLSCAALALLLLAPSVSTASISDDSLALTCERIPDLLRAYLQKHVRFHALNGELRMRAVDSYLKRIDPSKTLLLRAEADTLRTTLAGTFHDVRSGKCASLIELDADIVQRYRNMEGEVRAMLADESYAVDPSVMLVIDPEKRGYPETPAERSELYAKLVHFQISNYLSSDMELAEAKEKLTHRYELMTRRATERDAEDVYASFLDAFATALDPHSNYMSAEVLEDFQIGMGLSLEGIGVALSYRDGYSVVERIIPGGAADELDVLEPKDKIIAVAQKDGEFVDVIDMNLRDVVRLIRGKRGTKVHLTVLRQGEQTERLKVTIVRDKINLEDGAAKLRFEDVNVEGKKYKLAVLELPSFYGGQNASERQSSDDMRSLLKQAKAEKADGLLLDLWRNGGGLLPNSVEIAGFFIDEGSVVAVQDEFAKLSVLEDPDDAIVWDGPMVVLQSRASASASEIVAGAMKDYGRAVLVGDDHSFGKGTVQSMVPLRTGLGALKVTTALFFRPGGESTQHSGVASDIVIPSLLGTREVGEQHQDYSLPGQRIDPFLGTSTNGKQPWPAVTPELIAELSRRSAERVSKSEDFAEIQEQIERAESRASVVHLAEILQENEEAAKKNAEPEASDDDKDTAKPEASDSDEAEAGGDDKEADSAVAAIESEESETEDPTPKPTPQQLEALQILGDYVSLAQR
jgi:carboxyl-terminal processing protease